MRIRAFLILILQLLFMEAEAQSSLRLLKDEYPSRWLRTVPLSDTSIGLCLEDSNRFIYLTSCGVPIQSKELGDDRLFTVGTSALAADGQGGMVWIGHRQNENGVFPMVFLHLHANGSVLSMKQYTIGNSNFYPYSIIKAADNQFFVFGNASPTVGNIYRFILKLDGNGQVLAQHFAEGGGSWGGASLLKDGGLITRAGSVFYRYSAELNSLWGFGVPIGGDIYEAPVEVKGGFAISKVDGGTYGHYLFDENGALMMGRSIRIDSVSGWPHSFSDSGGGMYTVLERSFPDGIRPILLHWDSLGNLQRSLVMDPAGNSGNWLCSDGYYVPARKEIRLAGVNQKPGSSRVWLGTISTEDPITCWKPTSLRLDSLEPWNLAYFYLADRPTFSISVSNFPYRFNPKEVSIPEIACGSVRPMKLDLGPDTLTCGSIAFTLRNRSDKTFSSYRWQNGSSIPEQPISDSGTYWVQGFDGCEKSWSVDSIQIRNLQTPEQPFDSLVLCEKNNLFLPAAPSPWTGTWQDGIGAGQERLISTGGDYLMRLQSETCTASWAFHVDECELAEFPNFITPNGDDINDAFVPTRIRKHNAGQLTVWNRWGKKVDEIADFPITPWKPSDRLLTGLYFWEFSTRSFSGESKKYSGWIQLVSEP